MELTGTSNNVLTGWGDVGQYARIRLGQTLQTFNQLGQILSVLDFHGALNDGGNGELHNL